MTHKLKLQEINLEDKSQVADVVKIISELFENSGTDYLKTLRDYLENVEDSPTFYKFEDREKSIGFTTIHSWKPVPKPGKSKRLYWHVANFHLFADYRGQQLGGKFMELLLEEAEKQEVEKIVVFAGGKFGDFFEEYGFSRKHNLLVLKLSQY